MSKLYYDDPYAVDFTGIVISCEKAEKGFFTVLNQTLFYPEGGGQPYDTGFLDDCRVSAVFEKDGVIFHETDRPLLPGSHAIGKIDWNRRYSFMRHHTGEHIVSGIISNKLGLSNVGFHLGNGYATLDTNGFIDKNSLSNIEKAANQAILENIPIIARYPAPEELCEMNYRSKKELEGDIRIVEIPGYDSCACCGLHCSSTAEVSVIKFIEAHRYKGGMRIHMLCGEEAFNDYCIKNDDVYAISSTLSSKPNEIVSAVKNVLQENNTLKQSLAAWKNLFFQKIADETPTQSRVKLIFLDEPDVIPDDLRRLSTLVSQKTSIAAVFFDGKYAISSNSLDAKEFAKKMNSVLNGKGGGSSLLAQGFVNASKNDIINYFNKNAPEI